MMLGVCLDKDNQILYVTDYDNHRVQVYDVCGAFIRTIGTGS